MAGMSDSDIGLKVTDEYDEKVLPKVHTLEETDSKYTEVNISESNKTQAWLSAELRLDAFHVKDQSFSITGWINVSWKWDKLCPKTLLNFKATDEDTGKKGEGRSLMIMYQNNEGEDVVKVVNLLESDLSYYLPIDATKVFYQPSLIRVRHIDNPCLYYNKTTHLANTQYYLSAELSEELELRLFPFDKQFLNIKLRWNTEYYRILEYHTDEKYIPIVENWWGSAADKDKDRLQRSKELYWMHPLKVSLQEQLTDDFTMLPCWFHGKLASSAYSQTAAKNKIFPNLRFALIRMRIERNPTYFLTNVLFPFFIIVSCTFSIFAIDYFDIGSRLEISVTILLTFTAFQSFIDNVLPETSNMLLIDWYITFAYVLQALLIAGACVVSAFDGVAERETIQYADRGFASLMGLLWVGFSLFYMSLGCKCCRNLFGESWESRGENEITQWDRCHGGFKTYSKINDEPCNEDHPTMQHKMSNSSSRHSHTNPQLR